MACFPPTFHGPGRSPARCGLPLADLFKGFVRIPSMKGVRPIGAVLGLLASLALGWLLVAPSARGDVGITATSRGAGSAGDQVTVTLKCGFCFPPCEGPRGHRHPAGFDRGPCMPGSKAPPPRSFAISLVPVEKAPSPRRCGPNAICSPQAGAPPSHEPFTFLGLAVPPPGGSNPEHGDLPRYSLRFEIPHLDPGRYAYVVFCEVCIKGRGGSLLSAAGDRDWPLRICHPFIPRNCIHQLPRHVPPLSASASLLLSQYPPFLHAPKQP